MNPVKQFDLAAIRHSNIADENYRIVNRLNQMKIDDYERKRAKETGIQNAFKQAQGTPTPDNPSGMDYGAAQGNLMKGGYYKEGLAMQDRSTARNKAAQEQEQQTIKTILGVAKYDPKRAEAMWNSNPTLQKHGNVTFQGTKKDLQIFKGKDGTIVGINKTTGKASVLYKGAGIKKPKRRIVKGADGYNYYEDTGERVLKNVKKAGPKSAYTEKTARTRISAIDTAIANLKSGNKLDAITMKMFPQLIGKNDPQAKEQAIQSLKSERDYVSTFIPRPAPPPAAPIPYGARPESLGAPQGAMQGNLSTDRSKITVNGQQYAVSPEGIVVIDGKQYKVNQ